MKPELSSVFKLPASDLSEAELLTIRNDLHYESRGGKKYGFGDSQIVNLFAEDEETGRVSMPRRYAYERLSAKLRKGVQKNLSTGSKVKFKFNEKKQKTRPDLKRRQDRLIAHYLEELRGLSTPFQGGILSASCGLGKTVMAAKLMSVFNRTTLVLVHKEFLMDQWVERLTEFLDISADDVGFVRQKKCDFEGKKVVIAMIQSLLDPDKYPEEFYSWAGVVISDECHRMSAPCFQSVIPHFPAQIRVGLSATPRRADGLQAVFEWHIGPVLAKMKGAETSPKIYQIPFELWLPEDLYMWRDKKTGEVKKLFLAKLINILVDVTKRNVWFIKEMLKAVKSGRKVMLLSDRREHLSVLKTALEAKAPTVTVGFFMGGMKKKELKKSITCDIILGTFAMAKEALDIPEVDTLYLAVPKADIEQPVGRVLRYHPDKKEPVIVDLVDTLPACMDFAQKRLNQYKQLGYTVVKSI
jgi:superfamily II DNA or RNA helicase